SPCGARSRSSPSCPAPERIPRPTCGFPNPRFGGAVGVPDNGGMASHPLPLWRRPVTYAAIGATQEDDLVRFPPRGFAAIERKVRVGHGEERWHFAWTETLSWGIKTRSGFRVAH